MISPRRLRAACVLLVLLAVPALVWVSLQVAGKRGVAVSAVPAHRAESITADRVSLEMLTAAPLHSTARLRLGRGSGTEPAKDTASSAVAPARLVVRVSHAQGRTPAVAVEVRCRPFATPWSHRASTTDESGTCVLSDLQPGNVLVDIPGRAASAVELVAGETARVELVLPAGVQVFGRVLDREGNAIPHAEIACAEDLHSLERASVVGAADAEGQFLLRGLPRGAYLGARSISHGPSVLQRVPPESRGPLRIDLAVGAPGWQLRGRVLAADGRPVPGATLYSGRTITPEHARIGSPVLPISVTTDGRGEFTLSCITEGGPHSVWVRKPGYAVAKVELFVSGPPQELEIRIDQEGAIEGSVYDSGGRPLAGAAVYCESSALLAPGMRFDGPWWAQEVASTDEHGKFVVAGLPPGPAVLRAFASSRTAAIHVEVVAGVAIERNMVLSDPPSRPTLDVHGVVVDADGHPAPNVRVQFTPRADPSQGRVATTDQNGQFTVEQCQVGPSTVRAIDLDTRWPYPVLEVNVDLAAWQRVVLPYARLRSSLVGHVPGVTGSVDSVFVQLERDGLRFGTSVVHAGNGFALSLPPGTYDVAIGPRSTELVDRGRHVLDAGESLEVAFEGPPFGSRDGLGRSRDRR